MLVLDARTWGVLILAYCFVASLTPVWVLLQPRGYLGGFVLYMALAVGVVGIFFGGHPIVQQPAFKGWTRAGRDGRAVPVPVRDHRLRRLLGLPRPRLLGHHVEADRAGDALPAGGLRRRCCSRRFVALIALATVMIVSDAAIAGKGPGPSTRRGSAAT